MLFCYIQTILLGTVTEDTKAQVPREQLLLTARAADQCGRPGCPAPTHTDGEGLYTKRS